MTRRLTLQQAIRIRRSGVQQGVRLFAAGGVWDSIAGKGVGV